MRDYGYDREPDDYYYSDYRHRDGGDFFEFLGVIAFFAVIWWALRALIGERKAFNARDMEAFEHAERVRKELDAVKTLVAPKTPDPDYSLVVNATKKKS